ncbi:MAG: DUF2520 domain-containing protein [Planctomycetes bacterium]|nr:DUF2520 domain-containing protein [Planctomycetota bacterium]
MASPVAIFGMGRFGRALAAALQSCDGGLVRIGGRGRPHTQKLALVTEPAEFVRGLPKRCIVVVAVRDDALESMAATFAALPGISHLQFVHTSGVSGPGAFKPLADAGANTGVFHVLQSLPPESGHARIPGSYAAIAGPPDLVEDLRAVSRLLGVHAIELKPDQWTAYHTAAVLASNALLGLLDTAGQILKDAGVPSAPQLLLPLVRGTLDNAEALDLTLALTGPVARGDTGSIRRHLELLEGETRELYKVAMRAVVRLARRGGKTPPEKLAEINRLLN